jgi:hypothetical protein
VYPSTPPSSVDVQGVSLSIACGVDVQCASIYTASSVWTCRVYPRVDVQACNVYSSTPPSSVDVRDVSLSTACSVESVDLQGVPSPLSTMQT